MFNQVELMVKLLRIRNLTREQACAVVNEVFGAIAEALRNGEVARFRLRPLEFTSKTGSPRAGGS
jgi:hypothetical protein